MTFEYHRPTSLTDALMSLAELGDDTHVLAGGTALVLLMRQGLVSPRHVVDLARVPGLTSIASTTDGGLRIGAMATHRSVEASSLVQHFCPALAAAFGHVATIRIRHQGTIGGNLVHADPAQDPPPMLLALDAQVSLASRGSERALPLAEFFRGVFETALAPGEILTEVRIPPQPAGSRATYMKFLPRTEDDYATVAVAVNLATDNDGICTHARIALGAVGPTAFRAYDAEAALLGQRADAATIERVAEIAAGAADPLDDLRGSAGYKREMVRVWTRRALASVSIA